VAVVALPLPWPLARRRARVREPRRRHARRGPQPGIGPRLVAAYLVRRVLLTLVTLVTVSFFAFVCFGKSLDPSYPLVVAQDQTPRHLVQAHYHLTDPILERYWLWVKTFVHDGFGRPASTNIVDG